MTEISQETQELLKREQLEPGSDLYAFVVHIDGQDCSIHTIAGYLRDVRLFAVWFVQTNGYPLTPQALTPSDVKEYRQQLQRKKAAPSTINRKLAGVRAYAEWGRAAGLVSVSPVNGVKNVEQQKTAPRWLDKTEQFRLRQELEKDVNAAQTEESRRQALRNQAVVTLLLHTGLRVSELCALEVDDIELPPEAATGKRGRRKEKAPSGALRVRQGKGRKARGVPLNQVACAALRQWLAVRPSVLFISKDGGPLQPLFINKDDEPLQPRGVQILLSKLGRRADVKCTPHTCRHTFAKNLVDSGVSLEKVAALLGHSKLDTTMVYTTPSQHDLARAVEGLED